MNGSIKATASECQSSCPCLCQWANFFTCFKCLFINPLYNKILTFFKDPTHNELHHHFTKLSKTMTILRGITIINSSKSYHWTLSILYANHLKIILVITMNISTGPIVSNFSQVNTQSEFWPHLFTFLSRIWIKEWVKWFENLGDSWVLV